MDLQWWHIGALANVVITVAYLAISFRIARRLSKEGGRLRDNPLAAATAGIFLTCAVHHGGHPLHQLLPAVGSNAEIGPAMRAAFNESHVVIWDLVTAAVGIWYWTLREGSPRSSVVRPCSRTFENVSVRHWRSTTTSFKGWRPRSCRSKSTITRAVWPPWNTRWRRPAGSSPGCSARNMPARLSGLATCGGAEQQAATSDITEVPGRRCR